MIGPKEIEFSTDRIDKAEARAAHQRSVVDKLRWGEHPRFATLAEDTLNLMEARVSQLQKSHRALLAALSGGRSVPQAAALLKQAHQDAEEQAKIVASMSVGDIRKREAQQLLSRMYRDEAAAEAKSG